MTSQNAAFPSLLLAALFGCGAQADVTPIVAAIEFGCDPGARRRHDRP